MALINCPECGNSISDKAKACPFCGCPSEFFDNVKNEKELEENIVGKNKINDISEEPMLSFVLAGVDITYPKKTEEFAKRYGEFAKLAHESVETIKEAYKSAKDIASVRYYIIPKGKAILSDVIDLIVKKLYEEGVLISASEFWKKNSTKYKFDYENQCGIVYKLHESALEYKDALDNQAANIKASRSRWQGGGFGLSGAIKGAVTASALNLGSDIIHSVGDGARASKNSRIIANTMKEQKHNDEVFDVVCNGLGRCVLNAFMAYAYMLNEEKSLNIISLNSDKAKEFYEEALRYRYKDKDRYFIELSRCVLSSPGEELYYDLLIPEIVRIKEHNILEFMKFWNVEFIIKKYENDLNIGKIFDEEWKKEFKSISNWQDGRVVTDLYVESRIFCTDFYKRYNIHHLPLLSCYGSMLDDFYKEISYSGNFMSWFKVIEWIPDQLSIEDFFSYLFYEKESLKDSFMECAWILGDGVEELDKTLDNDIDKNTILMCIITSESLLGKQSGIYFTAYGVKEFGTVNKTSIRYVDVTDVTVYHNAKTKISEELVISAGSDKISIKDRNNETFDGNSFQYLAKLIIVLCVRYGKNARVWSEKMETLCPREIVDKENGLDKEKVICPACGAQNEKQGKFCGSCGIQIYNLETQESYDNIESNCVKPIAIDKHEREITKTQFDIELEKKGILSINFGSPDIQNYNSFRLFLLKNNYFLHMGNMGGFQIPKDIYYAKEINRFIEMCSYSKMIHADRNIFNVIPNCSFENFIKFILLDINNFEVIKFPKLFIKNVGFIDGNDVDYKSLEKAKRILKDDDILLFNNTGIVTFSGLVVTNQYVYSVKDKLKLYNYEVQSIEYIMTEKGLNDVILISAGNKRIRISPFKYVNIDIPHPSSDIASFCYANHDTLKQYLQYSQNIYYVNLLKHVLVRYGNNRLLLL